MHLPHTSALAALTLIALNAVTPAHAGGYDIAKANDCFKCHEIQHESKAPSFKFIANAFKGRSDAVGRIQNPIRNGITYYFIWEKMPAYRTMSERDLNELTQWILTQ